MVSQASRYATKYTKREIQNAEISNAGITRGLGLYVIKREGPFKLEKEYRLDVDALLDFLYKKVKLSDLENLTVKWGYPRLTYDQTLKILERK